MVRRSVIILSFTSHVPFRALVILGMGPLPWVLLVELLPQEARVSKGRWEAGGGGSRSEEVRGGGNRFEEVGGGGRRSE